MLRTLKLFYNLYDHVIPNSNLVGSIVIRDKTVTCSFYKNIMSCSLENLVLKTSAPIRLIKNLNYEFYIRNQHQCIEKI